MLKWVQHSDPYFGHVAKTATHQYTIFSVWDRWGLLTGRISLDSPYLQDVSLAQYPTEREARSAAEAHAESVTE